MNKRVVSILLLVLTFSFLGSVSAVNAQEGSSGSKRNEASFRSPRPSPANSRIQACQSRETAIKTRSSSLTRMANTMLEKFDSIAARVKEYYVKSGKTVANYDTLVATVATKRAAVLTALSAASTEVSAFDCTTNEAKNHMMKYQSEMKSVKQALNEYRTSIKNLIVAVRSESNPRPSMSPKVRPSNPGKGNL